MRRISSTIGNSGAHTSPGTPENDGDDNYGEGMSKWWGSERVSLPPATIIRRQISGAALMPYNNGRALPSKWDDAERWITSPVSGVGGTKNTALQPQRKPKSKSGPLGPPGVMYMPNFSPNLAVVGSGNGRDFTAGSALTAGLLVPDGISIQYALDDGMKSDLAYDENPVTQSANLPGSSDSVGENSVSDSQDNETKWAAPMVSRVVSRRDMATQMSPEGSTRSSFSIPPSSRESAPELNNSCSSMSEVRDVQVDKGAIITRLSRKQCPRKMKKKSSEFKNLACPWTGAVGSSSSRHTSKMQRHEAKITAWENLQKAKAEAAIRKLEVKLEKKRSESTDKILNKLRTAQVKVQAMRMSMTENQVQQSSRVSPKIFLSKALKKGSILGCFFRRN